MTVPFFFVLLSGSRKGWRPFSKYQEKNPSFFFKLGLMVPNTVRR